MEEKAIVQVDSTSTSEMTEPLEVTPIAELQPTSNEKIIEARVYRKWIAKTYPQKIETALCCILIDREGNAIQGNMNIRELDYFNPKIKVGRIYRISEFMCQPTNPYQQTIDNNTSLRFGKITKFDPITATDFPNHYFNFVSYNQLQYKIPTEDAEGRMQYPVLTDYIGCLRSKGKLQTKGDSQGDETIFRKVDIENLNGNVVELTMWDGLAKSLDHANTETMEQPIIIAVSSCRVSRRRDYQLTATSTTYCYLNPRIPEADQTRPLYRARFQATPPLRICKTPYDDDEKEQFRNRFPLQTILKQTPESYRGVKFTTDAKITSINVKRNWYYISCNECNNKATEELNGYRCLDHGKQPKPCYRYNFKAFITDPSATAPVTFFTPVGDDIVGFSCPELLAKHAKTDTQEIPVEIFAIEGQKHVFQIHFNETSKIKDFIVDRIFRKKNLIEGPSKEHQQIQAPPLLSIMSKDSTEEVPPETTTGTQITTQLQQGTPPPTLEITNEEALQEKTSGESKAKTVKRPLFQEQASNSKKQKAPAESTTAEKGRTKLAEKKKQN